MANKCDFFKADKGMSVRVESFMHARVWGIVIRTRANRKIELLRAEIAEQNEVAKTASEENKAKIAVWNQERYDKIEELQKQCKESMRDEATFELTDADKALYKAYKDAKTGGEVRNAIVEWAELYHLPIKGTSTLSDIVDRVSGGRKLGSGGVIRSNATLFTDSKRTKNDFLSLFYGRLAELMIAAGTIKANDIPEDVRAAYAKK